MASSLETVVYLAPTKKRKKPRNHTAATGQAAQSVAISFKRVFSRTTLPPSTSPRKGKSTKKLVTAVSLVPIITVVGLQGTNVLKVLLR